MKNTLSQKAFTLIEILVVVVILSILSVSVFVALNPAKRVKDANDARRASNISSILTAIHEYIVDNDGQLPAGLTNGMSEKEIVASGVTTGCQLLTGTCNVALTGDCVTLTGATVLDPYLASMPFDPSVSNANHTKYSVVVNTNGLVTVKACSADTPPITVSQ